MVPPTTGTPRHGNSLQADILERAEVELIGREWSSGLLQLSLRHRCLAGPNIEGGTDA